MIYTFYSYKGGVGRSMALANVAHCMAGLGQRVLMVDWDLEAPGLESFFFEQSAKLDEVRTELGVIDLLTAYKREFPVLSAPSAPGAPERLPTAVLTEALRPISPNIIPIEDVGGGSVSLLSAGWRAGDRFDDYAYGVQSFDWEGFYADFWGEAYFEWLRKQLMSPDVADVVLIDSRTGVTEMGGVCTRQLADVVVLFCAPNHQNLSGVLAMAQSFTRPDLLAARAGRDLRIVAVPTRIDNSEIDARKAFEERFSAALNVYRPPEFRKRDRSFWSLSIPYIPKYAYEERLAVGDKVEAEELVAAYRDLASQLLLLAPEESAPRGRWGSGAKARSGFTEPDADAAAVWSVPRAADPNFVNRVVELAALKQALGTRAHGVSVVTVLGGPAVGKSALVAQYVHSSRAEYDVVWWIRSQTRSDLLHDFGALAAALDLPIGTEEETAAAVRRWLERSGRWLLVFDDASRPGDLEPCLPTAGSGHVLVTTRTGTGWRRLGQLVQVGMLPIRDSAALLANLSGLPGNDDGVLAIADRLGGLPAALELAAAYLEETGVDPGTCAAELDDPSRLPTKMRSGLASLLAKPLDDLELSAPGTVGFLQLYGYLESRGVPEGLLGGGSLEPAGVDRSVAHLIRAGLAETRDGGVLVVHPLLVRSAQAATPVSWARPALERLNGAFPIDVDDPRNWPECMRLAPNALAAGHRTVGEPDLATRRQLLTRLGRYFRLRGSFTDAQAALDLLPGGSRETLTEKGLLHLEMGRVDLASSTLEGVLRSAEPVGGAALAEALTNVGEVRYARGDYKGAVESLERAVSLFTELSWSGHPAMANALSHLGRALEAIGRSQEAVETLERALQVDESVLGPADPRVASDLCVLGMLRVRAGELTSAGQALERSLAVAAAALGPDHTLVGRVLFGLSRVLFGRQRHAGALAPLERALAIFESAYGPAHPRVGAAVGTLGQVLAELGDEARARACFLRALSTLRQTLGEDHPDTRLARRELESLAPKLERRRRIERMIRHDRVGDALVLGEEAAGGLPSYEERLLAVRGLRAVGRSVAARRLLETLLRGAPEDPALLYELGETLANDGETDGAEAPLRRAAELSRGDPLAEELVGRIDKLRWRLRWQPANDIEARRHAATDWSDLAQQAAASFRRAVGRKDASHFGAVDSVALDALVADLRGPTPGGLDDLEEVRAAIVEARNASAPAAVRSDRQKREWIGSTAALAEMALLGGDVDAAGQLYRALLTDENLSVVELHDVVDRLDVYSSLGYQGGVVDRLRDTFIHAAPVAPVVGARFSEVAVTMVSSDLKFDQDVPVPSVRTGTDLLICTGMALADLFAAEGALEMGAHVRLLLPFDVEACRSEVERMAPTMARRFATLVSLCEVLEQPDRLGPAPAGVDPYVRSQRWCAHMGGVEGSPGHLTCFCYGVLGPEVLWAVEEAGAEIVQSKPA